jgi:2,4-dienoyl-CoA reductase-like NADH-dependent reductase (Old Yellow Enzyme family)
MKSHYPKIAQFKSVDQLRERLAVLAIGLPVDDEILTANAGSPLARSIEIAGFTVGNHWCIHPMEGWDAQSDGSPSAHTLRRWRNFGRSGAKLIWGGEAAAVMPSARANPRQTLATPENRAGLAALLNAVTRSHEEHFGDASDLWIGLQLTHSGRFCRPNGPRLEPRIAYHHPLLDARFGLDPSDPALVVSDAEMERVIDAYCVAAGVARAVGFHFVDIKACHGYLLHEFLSARARPGKFGGDLAGRTRALTTIIERVRSAHSDLAVGVRLSVFDTVPYQASLGVGEPLPYADRLPYQLGFGVDAQNPLAADLSEPIELIRRLWKLGVAAVNITAGSPYYCPHVQRPAIFPPSDGYLPPEDPLVGVWRHIDAARQCKQAVPEMVMVGSGYTYLQDYLPHVAQAVVRQGWIDAVGLGRMALANPGLPADCLATGRLARKQICRTFSDCTTGPRQGFISGCFPLDPYYKALPEATELKTIKTVSEHPDPRDGP